MNTFQTKDLPEAAFLYATGCKFIGLKSENNSKIYWFVFEDKAKCEELSQGFWNRSAQVSAKEYADALRTLKEVLFRK
jgi:hypothetical protein